MSILDKDNDPLAEQEALERHIRMALEVERPSGWGFELFNQWSKHMFDPTVIGKERLPDGPCLFVGNHSLFAIDGWVLLPIMMKHFGRFPRGMGDRFLFASERMGDTMLKMGGVMGHPEVCSALMEAGEDLLVFPGGAHEAVKPARQMYELQWKERYGFVKLAAKHGYTIMPFGLIGPDEFYDHALEGEDLPDTAFGKLLQRFGVLNEDTRPDMLPPIPLGALGTLIPKPERCYLGLGEPVDLAAYKGKKMGKKKIQSVREQVAGEIDAQLKQLLLIRERNRHKDGLLRKILTF